MEEDIRNRIKTVFATKGYTSNKLANGDSAMQNRLSRQMRGATLSVDTIVALLNEFPDLSAEWLLRGTGSMIKAPEGKTINIYRQGGDGDSQTNVMGDNNEISDKEALKMALQQNNKLIEALLNQK